jgi:ABC-type glycerol-3-phosphate transport system substrate-binding protein
MSRYLKFSLVALLALVCIVPVASARPGVVFRGYYGPGWYGPAWYGWYGPGWYAPYGYERGPVTGGVKFDTKMKDASVYVDDGYAGTVRQLKTFQLKPGAHDVELRDNNGNSFYQEHIEVVAGKTLKLIP